MTAVLLVDDDSDFADTLREVFEVQDLSVDLADNAAGALSLMNSKHYDLVLLDWQLPDMDGVEVCRQYRAGGGKTRILMLTGMRDVKSQQAGKEAGADDFLVKPFTVDQLLERVEANLKAAAAE